MSSESIKIEKAESESAPFQDEVKESPGEFWRKKAVPFLSRLDIWQLVVAVLSLMAAIVGLVIATKTISSQVATVGQEMEGLSTEFGEVKKNLIRNQFVITTPGGDMRVALIDVIRGKTPYVGMNHYLIITPIKTGDTFIQEGPLNVDASGLFTGKGKFGTGDVGVDEQFLVRVLATKSTLPPGVLTKVPTDAVLSEDITVTRKN